MTLALRNEKSAPVTVTLSKSVTRRLKTKGGAPKVTAQTASSTLAAHSRTLKVKRPKARGKALRRQRMRP